MKGLLAWSALVAILAVLGVILTGLSGASSYHPNTRLREEYYASVPPASRIVFWRFCPKQGYQSAYEANIATIGLNNWKTNYGNSIKHTRLADSCAIQSDLRLHAETPAFIEALCDPADQGDAVACHIPYNTYPGPNGSFKIPYAEIYFDGPWIDDILTSSGQDTHVFIHEFGHGMGLADSGYHNVCGTGAMSPALCTDTVDISLYPNDVCNADLYGGHPGTRCQ